MLMHLVSLMLIHVLPGIRFLHTTGPVVVAFLLMAAGLLSLRHSLTPFRRLHERLIAVRIGKSNRLEGSYPTEVQPLIDDLNALLEDREKTVKRALATAGDLAHGLKTPLALLSQEADKAEAAGNPDLAESIAQQVDRMSRQVTYQLARARAAASGVTGTARCSVGECVEGLQRTLMKLYAGRALHISTTAGPELRARMQREDLEEILGNLLDNACKWANSQINLDAREDSLGVVITLDDDGPGLDRAHRMFVLERGVRIDEAAPGSGLGLAIVRDLVELYGGSIELDDSPLGGLRARIRLPACEKSVHAEPTQAAAY
jgi:signal transduction histidine kinase